MTTRDKGTEETITSGSPQQSGHEATVAARPSKPSGIEDTVAAGSAPKQEDTISVPGQRSAVVQAIAPQTNKPDYEQLVTVSAEHYAIAGNLARGGMGRILRARDRRLGRDVAIKELLASDRDTIARFEREIRLTARLQHPSIVTVHEAGAWANGEPFYAMELVGGRALDQVVREMPSAHARLALVSHVIAVADALAYAHARGIIHRDLKPANVLVGEFGETVVIDWGLAKDLHAPEERTDTPEPRVRAHGETQFGAVVGTPAFMPPEQARGQHVDERADVYAIGAMLYTVLAGHAPFDGDSVEQVIDRVIREVPAPLVSSVPDVSPDLAAIVDKAMAREPRDRYADAQELAKDLRRFQTGQMVGARHYTFAQRVRRFVARNRVLVAVIAAALATLATVSAITITRIVRERDAAEAARADADTERARADDQRAAAEGLVGFMLGDLKPQLDRVGRLDIMRGVAKQVGDYYDRLTGRALEPEAIDRRAAALQVLGDVLTDAGDTAGANRAYRAAIELEHGRGGTVIARAQIELAANLIDDGKLDDAVAQAETARAALEAQPKRTADAELALAKAYRRLATAAFQRGKYDDSIALLAHCIEHARAGDARKELAKCHDRYSDAESARNNRAGAEKAARDALAIRDQIAKDDPGDLEIQLGIAVSWDKLYVLAVAAQDGAKAKAAADAAIALGERLALRDPDNAAWARALAVAYTRRADLASMADDPAGAAKVMAQTNAILERLAAKAPDNAERVADLADNLGKQGGYLVDAKQVDAGLALLRHALAIAERASKLAPSNEQYQLGVATLHDYLGEAYKAKRDFAPAAIEFRARLALDEALLRAAPDDARKKLNVSATRFALGEMIAHDRKADGVAMMTEALTAIRALEAAGQLSPEFASTIPQLAATLAAARK